MIVFGIETEDYDGENNQDFQNFFWIYLSRIAKNNRFERNIITICDEIKRVIRKYYKEEIKRTERDNALLLLNYLIYWMPY